MRISGAASASLQGWVFRLEVEVDRVPVSVSERLFGSFVLILFGDYVYFSGFNSHISKE